MADTLISGTTLVEKESRSIGDVPIGGIVAWLKSLSGVPNLAEGWVECDGSVLSDALSPLNGQTIPDLNGDNQFMRGNSTSGGTGGSTSHQHTQTLGRSGSALAFSANPFGTGSSQTIDDGVTISAESGSFTPALVSGGDGSPPFYNIVWIMRVR